MSFHRVLPLLPALSNEALSHRWAIQPDPLLRSKIMPEETPKPALNDSKTVTTKPKSSSLTEEQIPSSSPGEEELGEDGSPQHPSRSLPESDTGNHTKTPRLSLSKDSDWKAESPSSFCLCQPEPKVPRPRNAFILYRQHNQAAVVAQNPRLANPEVSKIIGDHWRNLSADEKNHWKLLADEEKIRHQKQYPEYRYQPRRSGRNGSHSTSQPSSTETSPRKCPKCGGNSIATSSMMSNSVSFPSQHPTTPYSPHMKTPNSSGRFMRSIGSPPMEMAPVGHRAPRQSTASGAPLRLVSPPYSRRQDATDTSPRFKRAETSRPFLNSPDSKRRRITNASYAPIRASANTGPGTPFPFASGHARRQSLPRPDFMGPSITSPVTMGPPPPPHNTQQHSSAPLTLAPIQNATPDSMNVDTQAKSLEAMILSIPTLGKIRVLAKISPPLAPPGPTSPGRPTRGLVIAIDAPDRLSLKQLTRTVSQNLSEYPIKIFSTPSSPNEDTEPSFQSYLRLIDEYHTLSAQITDFITTPPHQPSPQSSPSPVSPKSFPKHKESASNKEATMPIAIVPGYQVTWSDWFASHVGIGDAYSPMDHWQWGATLWRNVVGADITVAVQGSAPSIVVGEEVETRTGTIGTEKVGDRGKEVAKQAGAENNGGGERERKRKAPGSVSGSSGTSGAGNAVEVKLEDARAVIVKGEVGVAVAVGALRRVGFEIGEWVRGWGERVERRGSEGV